MSKLVGDPDAPVVEVKPVDAPKPDALAAAPVKPEPTPPTEAPETSKEEPTKPEAPSAEPAKADAPKGDVAAPATAAPGGSSAPPKKPDAVKLPPPNPKLTPQDDGSVLVDDKYPMRGAGTKEDPYRITWDQLVSSEETYQPRLGRKNIPDRVRMLDGKWVRISGYIAFPIQGTAPDEMLMMLNQWDGCCIGVPPTPYDAIEVKLKEPAKGATRQRVTGTVTGIVKVDPFLMKDWLISLYLMDAAELSNAAGQMDPTRHSGGAPGAPPGDSENGPKPPEGPNAASPTPPQP